MKHQPPFRAALPANDPAPATPDPATDPEIAALLDFEPVPRRNRKEGGWSPEMQRLFIAKLAVHGSPGKACDEVGMYRSGVDKVSKSPGSDSFRAAWAAAVELAERRRVEKVAAGHASTAGLKMPFVDNRRTLRSAAAAAEAGPLPGQMLNEVGDYEDEASLHARADDARDSISDKLRGARRLYLGDISGNAGKRAAFEMLTELPIDWARAERYEPQPDEPWRRPNMRQPDMLLTAENGWLGDFAHGPDKKAELRAAIDEARAEEGLDPVDWSEGTED